MTDTGDFMECATCRAKPGMPELCASCLHNRDLIARLQRSLLDAMRRVEVLKRVRDTHMRFIEENCS